MPIRAPLPLDKDSPRWIYESFRRLELAINNQAIQLAAVDRGEAPSGGGNPIPIDLSQYFYLPGRSTGQIGFGSNSQSVPTGTALVLQGFNLFTASNATNNSGRIELKQDCTIRTGNLRIVERDSTYTKGLNIALGVNLANATIDGSLRITPAGSSDKFLLLESASVDTAYGANKDDVIYRRLTSRLTGNFILFESSNSIGGARVTLSSIRKSDGAWVGPIAAAPGSAIEHSDTTDRDAFNVSCTANGTTALTSAALFGAVQVGHVIYGPGVIAGTTVTVVTDSSNITVSNAVTAGTEPQTRTFASDDHTQLIRKFGPTGQFIGAQPNGTIIAGGLQIGTRFGVGTVLPIAGNREVVHVEAFDWTTGTALNLVNFKAQHSGTGTVTGTHKVLIINNTGAPLRTGGSPSFTGIDITISPIVPSSLTDNILIGANFSALPNIGSGSAVNEIDGISGEAGTSSAGTVTLIRGATYTLRPGPATVGTMKGIDVLLSSTTLLTGTVTNAIGIDLDTFVTPATVSGGGAVTNWFGIRRTNTLPAAVTNKFMLYLLIDAPNIIAGPTKFGSTTTPTHFVEISGSTATKACIKLFPGSTLTTPVEGAIEYDGARIYFTDGGPNRRTLVYSSDTHNLLSSTHGDTTGATVVRGDLITGQTGPVWARLALGASGKFLKSDGTDAIWADPPTGTGSGGTSRVLIPAAAIEGFRGITHVVVVARSSGSNGTYYPMPLINTADVILQTSFVVPADFGSLTAFNIWITPSDSSSGNMKIKFGYRTVADTGSATATTTLNTNTIAADAVSADRIQVEAMDLTSMPSLSAGNHVFIEFQRNASSDATDTYENQVNVIAFEMVYTRA